MPVLKFKLYFEPRTVLGFLSVFLIIAVLATASVSFINQLVSISRKSSQAKQVVLEAERIKTYLGDFQLTRTDLRGKPSTLLLRHVSLLASLTAGDSMATLASSEIRADVERLVRSGSTSAPVSAPILAQIESLRTRIDRLQDLENSNIQQRTETASRQYYRFSYSFLIMLVIVVVLLGILMSVLHRQLRKCALTEQKLVEASARAHDLYENAPCGYFSFDQSGTIDTINTTLAGWLRVKPEQIVGQYKIDELAVLFDQSMLGDDLRFLRDGNVISNQHGFLSKRGDAETLPVVLNATPLWAGNKNFVGGRCTVFDSTEIQRAQAETKRTNSELEAFSYSVSHDLRAPLRSISGYSEILKEDNYERLEGEGKKAIDNVIRNARRMGQLIDDLLNFSRISRREIVKLKIDMKALVEEIVSELKEGTAIPTVVVSDMPAASADRALIRQVWINLISNAVKYSSKRPQSVVEIFATEKDGATIYNVRDNGSGFDMQYYGKLFGVFQRLHRADEFEGTGVGLALSKRIIEKHGGTIWAESQLNQGATFSFSVSNSVV